MTTRLGVLLAALALMLVSACGGGSSGGGSDLSKSDPKGAEACTALADAFKHKDDTDAAVAGVMKSGAAAAQAKTDAIRAAVVDLGDDKGADAQKMHDACVDAGMDMPDVPSS
ncbi:hypothetical protein [Angustibacter luteus]|uniref:Uncharacterized protein n=1 Tax=Angustibacter luteus TaxID=658456 RepID=A0ABW1JID5_9ACTN